MFEAYLSKLNRTIRTAEAVAVLEFAVATRTEQQELIQRYQSILEEAYPTDVTLDADEYADAERARRKNISNHDMDLDQILDDPRRGQGGKY